MIKPKKVIERFRDLTDCHKMESRLIGELRLLLEQPATAPTRHAILTILNRLLDNLPLHIELASQGGYLIEVRRLRPSWQRHIKALRRANACSLSSLHELCKRIRHESPSEPIDARECGEIKAWIRSLRSLREQECQLLQNAFSIDIGGEA
ncbi:hypothetical protein [Stieleria maiorica]|uniref:hypothetical protein n=1 Tax=Stieleria maiorica TaxID=2795974 RepID=UPI0011C94F7F|nr:hypothetical protein [Stieleria maiorica]